MLLKISQENSQDITHGSLFLVLSTKKYQSFSDIPSGYGKRFDVVLASDVLNINFHHILHIFLVSLLLNLKR